MLADSRQSLRRGTRYGSPDFVPSFEALEDHGVCYEMLLVLNDEGFAIDVFIPKVFGVDAELLAMCAAHAKKPPSTTQELPVDR